jgi:hypothetical protein
MHIIYVSSSPPYSPFEEKSMSGLEQSFSELSLEENETPESLALKPTTSTPATWGLQFKLQNVSRILSSDSTPSQSSDIPTPSPEIPTAKGKIGRIWQDFEDNIRALENAKPSISVKLLGRNGPFGTGVESGPERTGLEHAGSVTRGPLSTGLESTGPESSERESSGTTTTRSSASASPESTRTTASASTSPTNTYLSHPYKKASAQNSRRNERDGDRDGCGEEKRDGGSEEKKRDWWQPKERQESESDSYVEEEEDVAVQPEKTGKCKQNYVTKHAL